MNENEADQDVCETVAQVAEEVFGCTLEMLRAPARPEPLATYRALCIYACAAFCRHWGPRDICGYFHRSRANYEFCLTKITDRATLYRRDYERTAEFLDAVAARLPGHHNKFGVTLKPICHAISRAIPLEPA